MAPAAFAETIYGTLSGPEGPNRKLMVVCGNVAQNGQADKSGSYRLTVKARGRCVLRIQDVQQDLPIVLYEQPTRYDYEVTKVGNVFRVEGR